MTENLNSKINTLDEIIRSSGKIAVAFSGGIDSSYLLYRASQLENTDVTAITICTPYMVSNEIKFAHEFASQHNIKNVLIEMPIPFNIINNPADRCYLCKKEVFDKIVSYAEENEVDTIFDGTNADDIGTYRPGLKALQEMNIKSPLAISGLTKSEIRQLAKEAGLSFWDKPSMTCLLTRIPHNTLIEEKYLRKIEAAEKILIENGYNGIRVRGHGTIARIECNEELMRKIINDSNRQSITDGIKKAGFSFVSLDLEGYRSGSMD
ncbi:MAG: ATP-dependent sacrificial sulfur transferase LarE [Bacteroidales bacterium]|nr:ATP-dependent sacrificial sulfur transferase LarE [Bacteroidales bacterium]